MIPTEPDRGARPMGLAQAASAVLMVRPAAFGWNAQTAASNRFQRHAPDTAAAEISCRAREEFDDVADALRSAGVEVLDFDDRPEVTCPDAVFPNNWVSFHADGTVVLYPMLAPNRRRERRLDLLAALEARGGFRVTRLVDLTYFELQGAFLEGTGSLVLDHTARVAYACLSPRTHPAPLYQFCEELGYEPVTFAAVDAAGHPVYHTNVVLAIGTRCALVAIEHVAPADRKRLVAGLSATGRHVELLDARQTENFACNALELVAGDGTTVLAMSARAATGLGKDARARLERHAGRIVAAPIPTIEANGGGSVRCMLAEVFLPRTTHGEGAT